MKQLSERQQLGRALNALSGYFVRKLVLPKVFFEVSWAGEPVDLLAIDRTGIGDVHAVRFVLHQRIPNATPYIEGTRTVTFDAHDEVEKLLSLPAQYRYVAIIDGTGANLDLNHSEPYRKATFAEDGIGRVGELYVDVASDEVTVKEIIKPERFRSTAEILALTDKYVATHIADMEYRDPVEYQVSA